MEDLPGDFAIALGRVLFLGGRVEMLLDRLLAPTAEQPPRRGLSGKSLVKELRKVVEPGSQLEQITDGYEAMCDLRNFLVHGAHHYANEVLWTWHEPARAKGNAAFSLQLRLNHLRDFAQSWRNLADVAHIELYRAWPEVTLQISDGA